MRYILFTDIDHTITKPYNSWYAYQAYTKSGISYEDFIDIYPSIKSDIKEELVKYIESPEIASKSEIRPDFIEFLNDVEAGNSKIEKVYIITNRSSNLDSCTMDLLRPIIGRSCIEGYRTLDTIKKIDFIKEYMHSRVGIPILSDDYYKNLNLEDSLDGIIKYLMVTPITSTAFDYLNANVRKISSWRQLNKDFSIKENK